MSRAAGLLLIVCSGVCGALAQMRITEYMYDGAGGEFVEFTNVGATPVDMTGWSFDDDSATPGTVSLSAFGVVAAGEAVILTESTAAQFLTAWGLTGVDVIGGNSAARLGRNDQINLFNSAGQLVDRLTYGDEAFPGSIQTQGASGWVCAQALGANDPYGWVRATVGDQQGSHMSTAGDVGNPGTHVSYACPDAPTGACCAAGACSVTTEAGCTGVGLWQGAGTNCQTTTCPPPTNAAVRITEYMRTGAGAEFVEFTNLGTAPVSLTGWSFDDESREPGKVDLSALGTVGPGQSVILTTAPVPEFRTEWHNLSGVGVLGGVTGAGLGADDEINLYDNAAALVDRLTYGTTNVPGSIDANGAGAWPCAAALAANQIYGWWRAWPGDPQGSVVSVSGDVGSPGAFVVTPTCPTGSCCVAGQCQELTKAECVLSHGLFLGNGTNCAAQPCPAPSNAELRITEFMYSGAGGEFVEFTNLGLEPVDMSGWSFTDNADLPGAIDLGALGTLARGQSALLAEEPAGMPGYSFAADWGLAGVPLVVISDGELGRNDWVNLYDPSGTLVDRLQYGDEDFPGSIRTQGRSGWPCGQGVGHNNIYLWALSSIGDAQGTSVSSLGDIGSPGRYAVDCCGAGGPGDLDCDGDVDVDDWVAFVACLEGPGAVVGWTCRIADLDGDMDVDLVDYAGLRPGGAPP